jgi:membrane protein YdbS with pleckstrin-like domain
MEQQIWDKVLGKDEKIEYSFSIGQNYIKLGLICWGILSLPLLFAAGFGVVTFLIALFYYGFYLKKANVYAFTNKRILIHKGWLSTNTTSVDYSKITDIHVREPFLDKIMTKTGVIAINTAGSSNLEILLQHVENPYEVKKILDGLRD